MLKFRPQGEARGRLQSIVDIIVAGAKTGNVGDRKIFVTELADAIRVRTGETGEEAI